MTAWPVAPAIEGRFTGAGVFVCLSFPKFCDIQFTPCVEGLCVCFFMFALAPSLDAPSCKPLPPLDVICSSHLDGKKTFFFCISAFSLRFFFVLIFCSFNFFLHVMLFLQKDHPQNPIVREGCETDEDKLMRALGLGGSLVGDNSKANDNAQAGGKGAKSSLRGYSGFLALLYAFTEQTNGEVKVHCMCMPLLFWSWWCCC